MKNKPIYSNIFLTIVALIFIILYAVKCSDYNELNKPNKEIINIKHNNDSLVKNNIYLKQRVSKLIDSIYRFHIGMLKPDNVSGFFYVVVICNEGNVYTVIKLSSKTFSIIEAEDILKKRYKYKNQVYIQNFQPITEYCYLQYYDKYLRKYDK